MLKKSVFRKMAVIFAAVFAFVSLVSCGDESSDALLPITNTSTAMSQAEAQAFAAQISNSAANGMNSVGYKPQQKVLEAPVQINQQADYTYTCTSGGNMHITGSVTGSMDETGTGSLNIGLTETITDWACISGHVVNGDPYISLTGMFTFLNGSYGTRHDIHITGGFKTESASCQINLTINFNNDNTTSTSGTICGYSVQI